MPTTNAVPSADPSDLLFNAQKLDEVVNGAADFIVDRKGVQRLTLTGALRLIGFEAPVAFSTGLSITRSTQTVTNGGNTYHADPASLPFTTTGTFNGAQWRLVSNVTQADLTSYAIPRTGATDLTASFKTTGTWEAAGFKLDANALWSLVSSNPTWQADSGDTISYNRTSNKWSMYVGGTEWFFVTAADGPARSTDAATDDGLPRKVQVETLISAAVSQRLQYTLSAAQSTTSGTAFDFTSIPTWAKRITVMLSGVSTGGASPVVILLGTSTSFETTGYQGSACYIIGSAATGSSLGSSGINTVYASSANFRFGQVVITKLTGNTFAFSGLISLSGSDSTLMLSGSKALSDVLTRLRVTTASGVDAFDAGQISILIEG